jgi:antitoxin (DNA-binding transcriptional repressor) of toxin-antitoxin stability system
MIITATDFKAKCLQLLDRVNLTGERIQVTKRGKVVAELGPPQPEGKEFAKAGFAKGSMRIIGDIMEPIDVEWEAMK